MKEFNKLERLFLDWMAKKLPIPNLKKQIAVAKVSEQEYVV